jgi:hypothetical protein
VVTVTDESIKIVAVCNSKLLLQEIENENLMLTNNKSRRKTNFPALKDAANQRDFV